jgi:hypothetical protein
MNSEEQKSLEDFFKAKSIRIKNEMAEEVSINFFSSSVMIHTNSVLGFWDHRCCT